MPSLKCTACAREIDALDEGYFEEGRKSYCEKCYANKRWQEVDIKTREKWKENIEAVKAEIERIPDEAERRRRAERLEKCVPAELEPIIHLPAEAPPPSQGIPAKDKSGIVQDG